MSILSTQICIISGQIRKKHTPIREREHKHEVEKAERDAKLKIVANKGMREVGLIYFY